MKITIYELLGMIKEGKAPKKIKFNNIYCYYRECKNEYVDFTNKPIIQWDYVVMNSLNDEVEIIKEPQEHKIPEKLDKRDFLNNETLDQVDADLNFIIDKINEILDYLEDLK